MSKILFDLLGPAGLDLLLDSDDAGTDVTVGRHHVRDQHRRRPAPRLDDVFFDWDFKLGSTLVNAGAGIGFDIGIPGLGLETKGDVNLNIDWELASASASTSTTGSTSTSPTTSELELNVDVTVPGVGITGTLGLPPARGRGRRPDDGDDPDTHLGAHVRRRHHQPERTPATTTEARLHRAGPDRRSTPGSPPKRSSTWRCSWRSAAT